MMRIFFVTYCFNYWLFLRYEKTTFHICELLYFFSTAKPICFCAMRHVYQNCSAIGRKACLGLKQCHLIFNDYPIFNNGLYWLSLVQKSKNNR